MNNSAWLDWMTSLMEGGSRQSYAATFPPDRFYCLLDELPLHLVPRPARAKLPLRTDSTPPLLVNPECIFSSDGAVPDECFPGKKDLLSGFALQGTVAWVRDSRSRSYLPFWLGPKLETIVQALQSGEKSGPTLPSGVRDLLSRAGILTSPDSGDWQRHDSEQRIKKAAQLFGSKGYAPLSGLLHPFHVAALRRYYRHLIRTGAIRLGDEQSPRRFVAYNEPVARFFHHQIAATLSEVAGEPLKPSYVYLASYIKGAELKKHTDREQCGFSVTLCLDFSPEPELQTPWPICLETPTGTVTVYQALGDGLAYRGTRLPHYRSVLGEGQTSTSIFFHYVAEDFAGPVH